MNARSTRRDFLTTTGAALAAAATLPAVLHAAEASAKKRPLRKAIMWATVGVQGSVIERFKALKAAGFEGVEMMSHMDQDEVLRARDETGLGIPSVCGAHHWAQPLSSANPGIREKGLEALKQTLRDAKRYGASSVLLVPGVARDGVSYEECWERSIAEIRKAIPVAEETGVKIAIENVWNNFITKPEQGVEYVDAFKSPWVGFHFDIGNVGRYSPAETWIPKLGKRILQLHIKEFDTRLMTAESPGKGFGVELLAGNNNWLAIMKALDDIGYKGWGITEQSGEQTKDAEKLKTFVGKLERVFAS
ncbi:MAG: sugar phosphate isomerase/epimerase [Verrucomicrobia bacterium]|nr:sugar phosphate isomerase/epimerase [Verrucomicrobiota bacterium]